MKNPAKHKYDGDMEEDSFLTEEQVKAFFEKRRKRREEIAATKAYNPDQPRDSDGKFGSGKLVAGKITAGKKDTPVNVASKISGNTDAGSKETRAALLSIGTEKIVTMDKDGKPTGAISYTETDKALTIGYLGSTGTNTGNRLELLRHVVQKASKSGAVIKFAPGMSQETRTFLESKIGKDPVTNVKSALYKIGSPIQSLVPVSANSKTKGEAHVMKKGELIPVNHKFDNMDDFVKKQGPLIPKKMKEAVKAEPLKLEVTPADIAKHEVRYGKHPEEKVIEDVIAFKEKQKAEFSGLPMMPFSAAYKDWENMDEKTQENLHNKLNTHLPKVGEEYGSFNDAVASEIAAESLPVYVTTQDIKNHQEMFPYSPKNKTSAYVLEMKKTQQKDFDGNPVQPLAVKDDEWKTMSDADKKLAHNKFNDHLPKIGGKVYVSPEDRISQAPTKAGEYKTTQEWVKNNQLAIVDIRDFTGSAYSTIRKADRDVRKADGSPDYPPSAKQKADRINAAIDTAPKLQGTFFRGMGLNNEDLAKFQVGGGWQNNCISSYSKSLKVAKGFAQGLNPVIISVKAKSAVDIQPYSMFNHEKEVLFGKRTSFRVKSIKKIGKVTHVSMEEEE